MDRATSADAVEISNGLFVRAEELKNEKEQLDNDLSRARSSELRSEIRKKIQQIECETDDIHRRIKAIFDGMQPSLFGD